MTAALSWSNRVVTAAASGVTAAKTSGSTSFTSIAVDPAYPYANLVGTRGAQPYAVARVNYTTAASGTFELYIEVNWSTAATVRVVGVRNMRLPGTVVGVRFEALNAAGSTLETTTQVLKAELEPIPGTTDRYDLAAVLAADRTAARLRLRVQLAAAETGYIDAGVLWAGPAVVWDAIDAGWTLGTVDDSEVVRSRGGSAAASASPTRARVTIPRSLLTYAEAIGDPAAPGAASVRRYLRESGTSSPVLVVLRAATAHAQQVLGIYGLNEAPLPDLADQGGDRYRVGLTVEELR